jgi:hypothetical protein
MDQNIRLFCERVVGLMLGRLNEMSCAEGSLLENKKKLEALYKDGKITQGQYRKAKRTYGGWSAPRNFIRRPKGNADFGGRVTAATEFKKKDPNRKDTARSYMPLEQTPGEKAHIKGKPYTSNPKKK